MICPYCQKSVDPKIGSVTDRGLTLHLMCFAKADLSLELRFKALSEKVDEAIKKQNEMIEQLKVLKEGLNEVADWIEPD